MNQTFGQWLAAEIAAHPKDFRVGGQRLRREMLSATARTLQAPADQRDLASMFATLVLCRLLGYTDTFDAAGHWLRE